MRRFKNILLIYDQSENILERVVTLTKNNQAKLTIIDIVKELPWDMQMLITMMTPQELQERLIKKLQEQLTQVAEPIRDSGIQVFTRVLVGTPFMEIVRDVLRNERDLVIMSSERRGKLREHLFSSMAIHLMRKCPCPVWVIKPDQQKQFTTVLAAVDPDPTDAVRNGLNSKIMGLATSLARNEKCELHVVHAWQVIDEIDLINLTELSPIEVEELTAKTKDKHANLLNNLFEKCDFSGMNLQVHLIKDSAEMAIPDLAKRVNADVLVMGTVCRTGIEGFFIGNTAENVLREVDCSVLTVKPEGFVTPIKLS
jgi:nucleotide-binding universal stress UspA family protein|tara:strand:- start:12 stop:947 length:936 start_codon:yes stop_codon:yes gene_type:complete